MEHKAGYVNIIGNPNVGKSTLMNALVGERLAVITAKAQTTRRRMLGIVNDEDFQLVFSDTPGILKPRYGLQEAMMAEVETALEDADVFLLVTDMTEEFEHPGLLERIEKSGIFTFILINKVDLAEQAEVLEKMKSWENRITRSKVIPISALHGFNVHDVLAMILEHIPENPPFYDKDELTDKPERFFVSEIIRGCILEQYKKEIPYSVEVVVESFSQEDKMLRISAIVYVARESQKGILLGEGGKAIKRLGISSREVLERFFDQHIFLELLVKVSRDWRDNKMMLRRFGYQS
jgi:GTP-binding protein Era